MANTILIVEDESIIAMDIKETLIELGYAISGIVATREGVFSHLEHHLPDLILMDIQLKNGSHGVEIAKELKANHTHIPIVFLTGNTENETIQEVLSVEPYGYIVKPFKYQDLQTTLRLAFHRYENEKTKQLSHDIVALHHGYQFSLITRELFLNNTIIKLTRRETMFIECLVTHLNSLVSYETLENIVWEGNHVGYTAMRSLVFHIRSKLTHNIIINISGIGYKIEGNV